MKRLLANENIPLATIYRLRKEGFDGASVGLDAPSITDREVMQIAVDENRTIITFDRDYGELIYKYGFRPPAGVIYLRMQNYQPEEPSELLLKLLNTRILNSPVCSRSPMNEALGNGKSDEFKNLLSEK